MQERMDPRVVWSALGLGWITLVAIFLVRQGSGALVLALYLATVIFGFIGYVYWKSLKSDESEDSEE